MSIPSPPGLERIRALKIDVVSGLPKAEGCIVSVQRSGTDHVSDFGSYPFASDLKDFATACRFTGKQGALVTKYVTAEPKHQYSLLGFGDDLRPENAVAVGHSFGNGFYEEDPQDLTLIFNFDITPGLLTPFFQKFFVTYFTKRHEYKKVPDSTRKLSNLTVVLRNASEEHSRAITEAQQYAWCSAITAALVDAPPNHCHGGSFVAFVEEQIKAAGLTGTLTVNHYEDAWCMEKKMGAFLSVSQGSKYGAHVLHIVYNPGAKRKVAFVGKGITMDTGGYSLKSPGAMLWMKGDMGGAAAVAGAALAAGLIKPKDVEVHFIAMLCENMVGPDATRPGDIVIASNGLSIEVQNTDAEGRMALCDGLVFAQELVGEGGTVIDCATLTGAILVGLGDDFAAVYANDDELRKRMVDAGNEAGEPAWPMPLRKSYASKMKGTYADLKNAKVGYTYGGSITAGLFLQEFINDGTKWCHMDIAGPAWDHESCVAKGWGVSTFMKYLNKYL